VEIAPKRLYYRRFGNRGKAAAKAVAVLNAATGCNKCDSNHWVLIFACMNTIKLSSYYRLYAFPDYGSMKAALPYMQRVVLAKGLKDVEEAEIRGYVWRIAGKGYKDYLEPLNSRNTRSSAVKSLVTALQALYKSNGYNARYIVIERG